MYTALPVPQLTESGPLQVVAGHSGLWEHLARPHVAMPALQSREAHCKKLLPASDSCKKKKKQLPPMTVGPYHALVSGASGIQVPLPARNRACTASPVMPRVQWMQLVLKQLTAVIMSWRACGKGRASLQGLDACLVAPGHPLIGFCRVPPDTHQTPFALICSTQAQHLTCSCPCAACLYREKATHC